MKVSKDTTHLIVNICDYEHFQSEGVDGLQLTCREPGEDRVLWREGGGGSGVRN